MYTSLANSAPINPVLHHHPSTNKGGHTLTERVDTCAKGSLVKSQQSPSDHTLSLSLKGALTSRSSNFLDSPNQGLLLPFSQGQNSSHQFCMAAKDLSPFGTTTEGGRQYFDPQEQSSHEVGMARRVRSFSSESNMWEPTGLSSYDAEAAHLGAELTAQNSIRTKSASKCPSMIGVSQDRNGTAIGGTSIRKSEQAKFDRVRSIAQTQALAQVPGEKGKGHGYCAEQAVLHKALHAEQKGRFVTDGSEMTAIGTRKREGLRTEACNSCQHTNEVFGIRDAVASRPHTSLSLIGMLGGSRQRSFSISSQDYGSPVSSRSSVRSFSSISSMKSLLRK